MAENRRFTGKVAFVTGAASGIGRTTALAFAREGACAAVVDKSQEGARETTQEIERNGGKAIAVDCDVSDTNAVKAALERTIKAFGGVDIAFNNAGIDQTDTPLVEIPDDLWNELVATDLTGVFNCMKHEIPLLRLRGGGAIVNTSSGAGVTGIKGGAAYGAVKYGVIGMTKCAALDYIADNIRINAICPGIIDIPMFDRASGGTDEGRSKMIKQEPIGRVGKPEEIAEAVLYLCSDAAAFAVGHAMVVDGAQTAGLSG